MTGFSWPLLQELYLTIVYKALLKNELLTLKRLLNSLYKYESKKKNPSEFCVILGGTEQAIQ